jgi:hypothetical protein
MSAMISTSQRGSHESLCDHSRRSSNCCVQSCLSTSHDPQRRHAKSGTSNSPDFHYDQLHDVLQFAVGELSNHMLHSGAAYSPS